jgi:tetratricopeptide (TPR) repeat protein
VDRVARKYHGLLLARLSRKEALAELEAANAASPDDPEIELALAPLFSASGHQEKAGALVKSVIGVPSVTSGADLFAVALNDDINADETLSDAKNIVDTIDEQFDSSAFENDSPEAASTMYFLALEWARMGWATCLKGERLEGLRYMDAAWHLSQSATLASRLAKVYQKAGDTAHARHFFLLAAAAGAPDVDSAAGVKKAGTPGETAQAQTELLDMRTAKLPTLTMKKGQAEFVLVFSGSSRPERVEFAEGDPDLQPAEQALMDATYKIEFPDYSSLKIVRRGVLTCSASGCAVVLNPVQNIALGLTPSHESK